MSCRRCFGKTGVWYAARVSDNLGVVTTRKRSVKIRNCQATASAANHKEPQLKAPAFFPLSAAVILIVQERVAGDPLWLQIGEDYPTTLDRRLERPPLGGRYPPGPRGLRGRQDTRAGRACGRPSIPGSSGFRLRGHTRNGH